MKRDYFVRSYLPGDEERIVELLNDIFDGWPHYDLQCTSLEHWRWKYQDNIFKKSLLAVGVSNNEVISADHMFLARIKIGEKTYLCNQGTETFVHPEFRGMGVHRKSIELQRRHLEQVGSKLSYCITGNPILIESYSKRRPTFPHPVINLVRIKNINLQLNQMKVKYPVLTKLGFNIIKLTNKLNGLIQKDREEEEKELDIISISEFDQKINEFWERVSKHYDYIIERNQEYLNWRYCDPRAGKFIIRLTKDENKILGYSVLRINKYLKGYYIGYIVDLIALPDRIHIVESLIRDAVKYFDENEINIINCLIVKNHPYHRILNKFGFLNSRIKIHLFYLPLGRENILEKFSKSPIERIFVSWGDYDALPVRIPNNTI